MKRFAKINWLDMEINWNYWMIIRCGVHQRDFIDLNDIMFVLAVEELMPDAL